MKYKLIMSIGALIMLHTLSCTEIVVGRSKSNRWQAAKETMSSSTAKKVYAVLGSLSLIGGGIAGTYLGSIYYIFGKPLKRCLQECNSAARDASFLRKYNLREKDIFVYCDEESTYYIEASSKAYIDLCFIQSELKALYKHARIMSWFDTKLIVGKEENYNDQIIKITFHYR